MKWGVKIEASVAPLWVGSRTMRFWERPHLEQQPQNSVGVGVWGRGPSLVPSRSFRSGDW